MTPRWFIQEDTFPSHERDRLNNLVYVLEEIGCEVVVGKYRPFGAMEYDFFDNDGPVVLHGSIELMKDFQVNGPAAWHPGCWMDLKILSCDYYYTKLGAYILQNDYGFYTFGELGRLKRLLFEAFSCPGDTPSLGKLLFIRPVDNEKTFTGEVVGDKYFECWLRSHNGPPDPKTLCVVTNFKEIQQEWRIVMAKGKVVDGSQYKLTDHLIIEPGIPDSIKAFAEEVASVWEPHPVWVLDVGLVNNIPRVVELGSVNCAGWYACDQRKVVQAINLAAKAAYDSSTSI